MDEIDRDLLRLIFQTVNDLNDKIDNINKKIDNIEYKINENQKNDTYSRDKKIEHYITKLFQKNIMESMGQDFDTIIDKRFWRK